MRNNSARFSWLAAFCVVWAAVCVCDVLRASQSTAPYLEMRDRDSRVVRLSDFRGKVVLMDLWASWCAPCRSSFPALDALYREYRSRGLQVIAVSVDEQRRKADAFLRRQPYDMLVVFDPRALVLKALDAPGVPSSYLIDRQGIIRYSHAGYTSETLSECRRQIETLLAERP